MKRVLLVIMSYIIAQSLVSYAQGNAINSYKHAKISAFNDYLNRSVKEHKRRFEDWSMYQTVAVGDYQVYMKTAIAEYAEYRNRIMEFWGEDHYAEDGPKRLVEYSEDFQSRADVDLEHGTVDIEVLVKIEETDGEKASKLKDAVKGFVELKLDANPEPAFLNQLDLKSLGMSAEDESEKIAEEIVDNSVKESVVIDTEDGQKQLVRVHIELAKDHLSTRAAQYSDIVRKNSIRFAIDEPLIYAVIEQESAFNPRAKSSAPAYGLMQLVPKSGGRDAYRHVHGKDQIPLPTYLYVPENNVELGTGYLHKLMTVVFVDVTDWDSRMLCAIAAYNTGAGNVSRALTGGTSITKAVAVINSMPYDKLYECLRTRLPYSETRNYIQQVTSKRIKYMK